MANFFEKLKKGMGIEMPAENEEKMEEKEKPRKAKVLPASRQVKKIEIKEPLAEKKTIEEVKEKSKEKEIVKEEVKAKEPSGIKTTEFKEAWLEPVGQLAVDVYQTENELVIQSAIAGVKSEDLDISLEGDVITIAGERKRPFEEKGDYFSQECYWGKFSRQIISPVEVDPNRIEAALKDGILTIRAPKLLKEKKRKIIIKG
jgi:HSP20 family molecular chaperone IbpA